MEAGNRGRFQKVRRVHEMCAGIRPIVGPPQAEQETSLAPGNLSHSQ